MVVSCLPSAVIRYCSSEVENPWGTANDELRMANVRTMLLIVIPASLSFPLLFVIPAFAGMTKSKSPSHHQRAPCLPADALGTIKTCKKTLMGREGHC